MYHDHFNKTTPYRNMRDAPVTKALKKGAKIRRLGKKIQDTFKRNFSPLNSVNFIDS